MKKKKKIIREKAKFKEILNMWLNIFLECFSSVTTISFSSFTLNFEKKKKNSFPKSWMN